MGKRDLLSEAAVAEHMQTLTGWEWIGKSIQKEYQCASFTAAIVFVGAVAHLAELADHHPDILIQYRKVTLTFWTHTADGLTLMDFDMAAKIDALDESKA